MSLLSRLYRLFALIVVVLTLFGLSLSLFAQGERNRVPSGAAAIPVGDEPATFADMQNGSTACAQTVGSAPSLANRHVGDFISADNSFYGQGCTLSMRWQFTGTAISMWNLASTGFNTPEFCKQNLAGTVFWCIFTDTQSLPLIQMQVDLYTAGPGSQLIGFTSADSSGDSSWVATGFIPMPTPTPVLVPTKTPIPFTPVAHLYLPLLQQSHAVVNASINITYSSPRP